MLTAQNWGGSARVCNISEVYAPYAQQRRVEEKYLQKRTFSEAYTGCFWKWMGDGVFRHYVYMNAGSLPCDFLLCFPMLHELGMRASSGCPMSLHSTGTSMILALYPYIPSILQDPFSRNPPANLRRSKKYVPPVRWSIKRSCS